jgi:hypothetical protein
VQIGEWLIQEDRLFQLRVSQKQRDAPASMAMSSTRPGGSAGDGLHRTGTAQSPGATSPRRTRRTTSPAEDVARPTPV